MICPNCGHHTWHVNRSVHEDSHENHKRSNAGALKMIRRVLAAQGTPDASWHYRKRVCRRCGHTEKFMEVPLREPNGS